MEDNEGRPEARLGLKVGNYELTQYLGDGISGWVYRGVRLVSDDTAPEEATVKFLKWSHALGAYQRDALLGRFRHDMGRLSRLRHPNMLQVLSFGDDGSVPYLIFPHIRDTLASLRDRQGGTLPVTLVRDYLTQLSAAVDYAHEHQIVHGNINPTNIWIDESGHVYLAEFWVSRLVIDAFQRAGSLHGIPIARAYLAPEQTDLRAIVTGAADIYALGVVTYELITGRLPFAGNSTSQLMAQHVHAIVPPPSRYTPAIASSAEVVILTALRKEQSLRFSTARLFAEDFALGIRNAWPGDRTPDALGETTIVQNASLPAPTIPHSPSPQVVATLIVAAVVVLFGILIFIMTSASLNTSSTRSTAIPTVTPTLQSTPLGGPLPTIAVANNPARKPTPTVAAKPTPTVAAKPTPTVAAKPSPTATPNPPTPTATPNPPTPIATVSVP